MEIKSLDTGVGRRKNGNIRHLEVDKVNKSEITKEQFEQIRSFNMDKDPRYGAGLRLVAELEQRYHLQDVQCVEALTKLNDMRQLKRERVKLLAAVTAGTASREDRELISRSKNLEKDLEAAEKRDLSAQTARDKIRDNLDQAKLRHRDLCLKDLGITCVSEEGDKYFRESSGTTFLAQDEQEDEKIVGREWVKFWLKDAKLESLTTLEVRPLIKRYYEAIADDNPDKKAIQIVKELLHDQPLVPRIEFLKLVAETLNEDIRRKVSKVIDLIIDMFKFVLRVNAAIDDDEKNAFLRHSMDPQKSARQEVKERRTISHEERSLLKSASEVWDQMPAAKKATLGIGEHQIRRYMQGGGKRQFSQTEKGRSNSKGRYGNRNSSRNHQGGNYAGGQSRQGQHNRQDRGQQGHDNNRQNNSWGSGKPNKGNKGWQNRNSRDNRDHRPIPSRKEDKKDYNE
ncbi:unnamed protein product [Oikopleura dioica]|uniref:Uncharacterized protein n=1 Tax=Oikopleura dioica TaxID=34765 RepID=E4XQC2_OIKDI|nr:unnamed protein product [Oikopleura dioica]